MAEPVEMPFGVKVDLYQCHIVLGCISQFILFDEGSRGRSQRLQLCDTDAVCTKGCGVFIERTIGLSVLSKCRCGAQMAATICFLSVVPLPQQ